MRKRNDDPFGRPKVPINRAANRAQIGSDSHAEHSELTDCALRLSSSKGKESRIGTAFFSTYGKKKYIITAYHNIDSMENFFLLFREDGLGRRLNDIVTDRVLVRPELDLAIFECTEDGVKKLQGTWEGIICNRRPLPLAKNRFLGQQVVAVGNARIKYPVGERRPLNSPAWAFISEYTSWEKVLDPRWYEKSAATMSVMVMTNIDITKGHSGGPVVVQTQDPSYQIAGMLVGGDPKNPSRCWGIPSDTIADCLDQKSKESLSLTNRNWIPAKLYESGYSSADTLLAYPYSISVSRPLVAIAPLQLPDVLKREMTPDAFIDVLHKFGRGGICYQAVRPGPRLTQFAQEYRAGAVKELPEDVRTSLGASYLLLASLSIDGDEWVMTGSLIDLKTLTAEPVNSVRAKKGTGALDSVCEGFWREFDSPAPIILEGHTGQVTSIALSLDGRTAVSGGMDKTLRVWDVTNRKQRHVIPMDPHFAGGAISVDGRFFAMPHRGGFFYPAQPRILSLETGKDWEPFASDRPLKRPNYAIQPNVSGGNMGATIRNFETGREYPAIGHTGKLGLAKLSPTGSVFVEVQGNDLWVWEADTGKRLATLAGHIGAVQFMEFSPDGSVLATGAADKAVRLWDMRTGKECASFAGYCVGPFWMKFSEDGQALGLWSYGEKVVRVIDVPKRKLQATLRLPQAPPKPEPHIALFNSYPFRSQFVANNRRLLVPWGNDIRVWDTTSGEELPALVGHTDFVLAVAASPDGRRVVSGSKDRTVRFWDLATGKGVGALDGFGSSLVWVGFSKDSKKVGAQSGSELRIVEAETKKETTRFFGEWELVPTGIGETNSPNGEITAVPVANEVQLRSTRDGKVYATLKGKAGRVLFSPDSRLIATESFEEKEVRLFDTNVGFPALDAIKVDNFFEFRFSADKRWFAVSANGGAGVWDTFTRTKQISLPATGRSLFSSDSKVLIAVPNKFADKWLRVWDLRLGEERTALKGLQGLPSGFGVSLFNWGLTEPDGYVVAASFGRTIALWPIREGGSPP